MKGESMKGFFNLFIIIFLIPLVGCGGGNDSGSPSSLKNGVFQDSPVRGLSYSTPTVTGITDSDGIFQYQEGETVEFHIGNTVFGECIGKDVVTPIDLVGDANDGNHPLVVSIIRFLQTLDEDNELCNGIHISNDIRDEFEGISVDLNNIENDYDFQARLDTINTLNFFTSNEVRTLVTEEQAKNHFGEYLAGNCLPQVPPIINIPNMQWSLNVPFELHSSNFTTKTNADPILSYELSDFVILPSGLSFDSSTGIFQGDPTATGDYDISIRAKDRGGLSEYSTFTLSISSTAILEGRSTFPLYPIYFDNQGPTVQSYTVRPDQLQRLNNNANYLLSNPNFRIRIEGNTDERDTNEYNMDLGQRMAISVKNLLVDLGVNSSRLDTLSYGEERPLNLGHDELSWSQNRRVDFVIVP